MIKVGFDWDERKNELNHKKHGISFYEAQNAFFDPKRIIAEDLKHSEGEKRYFCIGKVGHGIIIVRFTHRAHIIRIIGAGYWRKGKQIYEEKNTLQK